MHLLYILLSLSVVDLRIVHDLVVIDILLFELYVGYLDLRVFIARVRFGEIVLC